MSSNYISLHFIENPPRIVIIHCAAEFFVDYYFLT